MKTTQAGCPAEDWEPTFAAYSADGTLLVESRILLLHTYPQDVHVCGGAVSPHG